MRSRLNEAILGCALALGLTACTDMGELRRESKTVDSAGAQSVEVRLRMGAGELRFAGGANALMEAEFAHRGRYREPEVDYRVSGTKGILTVRERRSGFVFRSSRNDWDLRLKSGIPADLNISLGAGEGRLDLRDIDVRSLDVDMGVGSMQLDLRGKRGQSFDVSIDGGIGSGQIRLPSDVGVRVRVDGGIGSVNAPGFTKSGHVYTNDALGKSPVTIDIRVDAGIGSINLSLD